MDPAASAGDAQPPQSSTTMPTNSNPVLNHRKAPLALLVGYVGTDFLGLQQQPVANRKTKRTGDMLFDTIEGTLLKSIGPVLETTAALFRAARTDKGVSAVRNVLTTNVKQYVIDTLGGLDKARDAVNDHLEERGVTQIRIYAIIPIVSNFEPRTFCQRRVYQYLIPLFTLHRLADSYDVLEAKLKEACTGDASTERTALFETFADTAVAELNEILKRFKGFHRFYNFTEESGPKMMKPSDTQCVRCVYRLGCVKTLQWLPTVDKQEDKDTTTLRPYVLFQIEGISFLMHMIRKILGASIAVMRGSRATLIDDALSGEHTLSVPMAPGEGLLLNALFFDSYDTRSSAKFPSFTDTFAKIESDVNIMKRKVYERITTTVPPSQNATGANSVSLEMSKFVRLLRVHNWNIQMNRYPACKPIMKRHDYSDEPTAADGDGGEDDDDDNVPGKKRVRDEDEEKPADEVDAEPTTVPAVDKNTPEYTSLRRKTVYLTQMVDRDDGWVYDSAEEKRAHWTAVSERKFSPNSAGMRNEESRAKREAATTASAS